MPQFKCRIVVPREDDNAQGHSFRGLELILSAEDVVDALNQVRKQYPGTVGGTVPVPVEQQIVEVGTYALLREGVMKFLIHE